MKPTSRKVSPQKANPKSMKGPPKIIFTTVACGSRYQPNYRFLLLRRKLQRQVHQVRGLLELKAKNKFNGEFFDLKRKITKFCSDMSKVGSCLNQLLDELTTHRQKLQDQNIQAWRHRLQTSQSKRHRWLKNNESIPSVNLTSTKLPHIEMPRKLLNCWVNIGGLFGIAPQIGKTVLTNWLKPDVSQIVTLLYMNPSPLKP